MHQYTTKRAKARLGSSTMRASSGAKQSVQHARVRRGPSECAQQGDVVQHGDAAQHRAAHSTRGWSSSHATTKGCYLSGRRGGL